MAGVPHTPGTREYLTCERGAVELAVAGERYRLAKATSSASAAISATPIEPRHATQAVAYSAIAFAPRS